MKKIIYLLLLIPTILLSQEFKLGDYKLENLAINTKFSDFGTNFYGKEEIIFSSPRKKGLFTKVWKDNEQPFLELYIGKIDATGSVINVEKFEKGDLNSKYHDASFAVTKDLKVAYFTTNNAREGKFKKGADNVNYLQLYRADIDKNGNFTNLYRLPFNSDDYSCGHPSFSEDEQTLYFTSDMPGGYGKTDIYKVSLENKIDVGEPVNMGSTVNTSSREMFPYMDKDKALYYASDREGTLGGLDVFASVQKGGLFVETVHMPSPINSNKDDFAFSVRNDELAYLSSDRFGGKGSDDIYKIIISEKEPKKSIIADPTTCYELLSGMVKDVDSGSGLANAKVILVDKDDNLIGSTTTNISGVFTFNNELDCSASYKVKASKKDYNENKTLFRTTDISNNTNKVSLILATTAIENENTKSHEIEKIIRIDPIYFDYDKSFIRADAAAILDKVVKIMQENPSMIVEGGSHTDVRGSRNYNERLSSRRAKSTVDYIISKGISSDRISSKGYGESQPVNHCVTGVTCSDEEHEQNRRTQFKILNY